MSRTRILAIAGLLIVAACSPTRPETQPAEPSPDAIATTRAKDATTNHEVGSSKTSDGDLIGLLATRRSPTLVELRPLDDGVEITAALAGYPLKTGTHSLPSDQDREFVAGLDRATTYSALVAVPFDGEELLVVTVIDPATGEPVRPEFRESFRELVERFGPGSTNDVLERVIMALEAFGTVEERVDPVAAWLAIPPSERYLDQNDTPRQILDDYTTPATLGIDMPDDAAKPGNQNLDEDDVVLVRLFDPEFAEIYSGSLAAGDHFLPVFLTDGSVSLQFLRPNTGEISAPIELGDLQSQAAALEAGQALHLVVTGYADYERGQDLDELSARIESRVLEERPAEIIAPANE